MYLELIRGDRKKVLVPLWLIWVGIMSLMILVVIIFFTFLVPLNTAQANDLVNMLYASMFGTGYFIVTFVCSLTKDEGVLWPMKLKTK